MDATTASQVLDPGLTGRDARPVDGVENGYLAGYRVRFDEAGPDGNLRISAHCYNAVEDVDAVLDGLRRNRSLLAAA